MLKIFCYFCYFLEINQYLYLVVSIFFQDIIFGMWQNTPDTDTILIHKHHKIQVISNCINKNLTNGGFFTLVATNANYICVEICLGLDAQNSLEILGWGARSLMILPCEITLTGIFLPVSFLKMKNWGISVNCHLDLDNIWLLYLGHS